MKTCITAHKDFIISDIDRRIFGSFIEHLGRAVYTGVYEKGHSTADEDGFREDVLALVNELDISLVRYPGGNFVSSFNWEDSVGPLKDRPKRLDLAWKSLEPNTIGLDEFFNWTQKANTELMMAINLGTRGIPEASNLLEYCNHPGGSFWSDLRRTHGRTEPYNIKMWCLGNELDGPWQVGQKTAYEYGRLANETAKAIRLFDDKLEIIVCGSSLCELPTFPDWEREVLEQCYENVDYLSLHMYMNNNDDDLETYMASSLGMDQFIETVVSVCDFVKAKNVPQKLSTFLLMSGMSGFIL